MEIVFFAVTRLLGFARFAMYDSFMQKPRIISIEGRRYLGGRYPFDELKVGMSFFVPMQRSSPTTVKDVVRLRNQKGRGIFLAEESRDGTKVTRLDPEHAIA